MKKEEKLHPLIEEVKPISKKTTSGTRTKILQLLQKCYWLVGGENTNGRLASSSTKIG